MQTSCHKLPVYKRQKKIIWAINYTIWDLIPQTVDYFPHITIIYICSWLHIVYRSNIELIANDKIFTVNTLLIDFMLTLQSVYYVMQHLPIYFSTQSAWIPVDNHAPGDTKNFLRISVYLRDFQFRHFPSPVFLNLAFPKSHFQKLIMPEGHASLQP